MKNKKVIIALAGLSFGSGNLGCSALAISFYNGLVKILKELNLKAKMISLSDSADTSAYVDKCYPIEFSPYHLSKLGTVKRAIAIIDRSDFVIDFTEGDSFADLYGYGRFFRSVATKLITINRHKCLILGPQTYGPYDHTLSRIISFYIITHAKYVFSRDYESLDYLKSLGVKRKVIAATDVAFLLPYKKETIDSSERISVGINVSGLLWDQCERNINEYSLKINYKVFCEQLIKKLLENNYKVYLVPHVGNKESTVENDYNACLQLHSQYPATEIIDNQFTAIGIKNYISAMDIFIGSRMHSTIAAFSSGVFTIPVAYSKKFQGYYEQLKYPVMVDARNISTKEAIDKTLEYVEHYKDYDITQKVSMQIAEKKLNSFYNSMKGILREYT